MTRLRSSLAAAACIALALPLVAEPAAAAAPPTSVGPALRLAPPQGPLPQTGCVITGTTAACDLWAKPGTIALPGAAAPVPIWGFAGSDAAPATLPGPVLMVDQGDTVTITIHNGLASALALALPTVSGLAVDTAGAAPGGTKAYTFTASRPGTYLYEAGHTADGARQVAMGLVGALVVRAPAVGGRPSAYGDAGSAYDDEDVLVLTEVDPALNANPTGFDLRTFNPTYRLINGKAFPETDAVATDVNRTVLLRYIDAGLISHPMTVLGLDQTVIGRDSRPGTYPEGAVTIPLQPGQVVDALVNVPAGPDGARFALMEAGGHINNAGQRYGAVVPGVSPQQAFGGMLTFIDTNPPPPSGDQVGPTASHVVAVPDPASVLNPVTVTANFSDVLNGNSPVDSAELVVDDLLVAEGTGIAFTGSFGSPTVTGATATISTAVLTTLAQGRHTVYVRGHDAAGNWGVVGSTTFNLSVTGPVTTGITLTPNPTGGAADVTISATGDDSGLGGTVAAAEYFLDAAGPNGTGTAMSVAGSGATVGETGSIPAVIATALAEGKHTVLVHNRDSLGLWGPFGSADLVIDRTGPTLQSGAVVPSLTNGINGSPADPTDLRVDASFTDALAGGVNSPIATAEGFLDTAGTNGSGFTFLALDGSFSSPTEATYTLVPLTQLNGLGEGTHQILVHARDAAGNWGPLVGLTFAIDRTGPVVSGLTATPNPVAATATLNLSATATDAASAIAAAEWFEGADPGVGNGHALTVSGNAISGSIPPGTLAVGSHTLRVRASDAAGNWGPVVTVSVTVSAPANAIFADSFATNNTSAWSQTVGTASAATGALVVSGQSYVVDNTPAAEGNFFAKFDLTVGSYNAGNAIVDIFQGRDAASNAVVNVQLRRQGNNNQVRLGVLRSNGWIYSGWTTVTGTVTLHLTWHSVSVGTAASLQIGNGTVQSLTGNTSAYAIESAALGLVARTTNAPTGSATFDNYASTRTTAP
jgi:FtsP/CotA-like multicopper oxidase with cupredoxin domain